MKSRTPWQRMTLSLLGVLILLMVWRWAVCHLYTLPEAALAPFVSITTNIIYGITAIIVFMVTGRLVYEWSNRTEQLTNAASDIQHINEDITQTVRTPKASHFDDGGEDLDHD